MTDDDNTNVHLSYIAEMLRELCQIAANDGDKELAYFLDMAVIVAEGRE
ncbi:hypothetical protein [Phyllobacterium leguminum]|uniref:Uncharacterized protein n=1 Tax=Phyllobacterium leguminum TaxID=314237 RepID=A0A318T429_9HYPH|nr:hypothetical protein [Phyllobacterium leguminum]PYE89562.1 hypothetical protein C7477_10370 [Phyllobacterium leguminum]